MSRLNVPVSAFASAWSVEVEDNPTAREILDAIRSGKWKHKVELLRSTVAEGDDKRAEMLKKALPAVTFSGKFTKRSIERLEAHSGLLVLDFDKLGDKLPGARAKLRDDPHTLALFDSPTNTGLKVIVPIDPANHGGCWWEAAEYYRERYGLTVDEKTKDVSRLCFVSYDPSAIIRDDAEPFSAVSVEKVAPVATSPEAPPIPATGSTAYAHAALEDECSDVASTPQGGRNDRLNKAAFNIGQLVARGELPRAEAEARLLDAARRAGLDDGEAATTIRSGLDSGARKPRAEPDLSGILSQAEVDKDCRPWKQITVREIESYFRDCALWSVIEAARMATAPPLPFAAGLTRALPLVGCALSAKDDTPPSRLGDFVPKRGARLARLRIQTSGDRVAFFWIMGIASPSTGKDIGDPGPEIACARKWFIGTGGSEAGLLDALMHRPVGLLKFSEFENFLKPNHWMHNAIPVLNDLFSNCWFHQLLSERSSNARPRESDYAVPSILANVQPEKLLQYGSALIGNGFFNRWLLIVIPEQDYRPAVGSDHDRIAQASKALDAYTAKRGVVTPPADYLAEAFTVFQDGKAEHKPYWQRLVNEYGPRLAVVLSVPPGDTTEEVNITPEIWRRTARTLLWLYAQAEPLLDSLRRDPSDKWEDLLDRVHAVIARRGPCTIRTIHQFTGRGKTRDRYEAITELMVRGRVVCASGRAGEQGARYAAK